MMTKVLFAVLAVMVAALAVAPPATFAAAPYGLPANYGELQAVDVAYSYGGGAAYVPAPYEIASVQYQTLSIDLPTEMLFSGAQLMIDALSSPYMLIAGLGLGVAILAAVMAAVNKIRM